MFCRNCGHNMDDKAVVCTQCGVFVNDKSLGVPAPVPAPEKSDDRFNILGIAAFTVSIASIWLGIFLALASIAGLGLSIPAFVMRSKYNRCNGLAVAGMVISIVSSVFWIIFWLFIMFDPTI